MASNQLQHVFTWKIINFSMCSQRETESLQSSSFKANNINENAVWCLTFYPRGNRESHPNYAAIFLVRNDHNSEVTFKYSIEIIGSTGEVFYSGTGEYGLVYESEVGFSNFVDMNDLCNNPACLPDDTLTIRCHMKGKTAEHSKTSRNFAETKIGFDRITFKWNIENAQYTPKPQGYAFRLGTFGEYEIRYIQADDIVSLSARQIAKKDPNTKVVLKISFIENNNRQSEQTLFEHLYKENEHNVWIIDNFLTKAKIRSEYKDYVWDKALHMNCEFSASNETQARSIAEYQYCPPICENTPSDVDTVAALMIDLQNMYANRKYTDVKLISKEQFPIDAHKAMLSARSKLFSRMLADVTRKEVSFPSVTKDILEKFVEYVYTDAITDLDMDSASDLIVLAVNCEMPSLREYCYQFKNERIRKGEVSQFLK